MTPSLLLLLLLLFLCTLYACAFTPTAPYFRKLSKLPIANGLSRSSLPLFSTFDNEDGEHDEDDEDEDEDDGPSSDGLEMLLVDADKFRRKRPLSLKDTGETRGGSTSSNVKDIISTIVTADFFLICFFLLWFVTGAILSIAGVGDGVQVSLQLTNCVLAFMHIEFELISCECLHSHASRLLLMGYFSPLFSLLWGCS